MGLINRYLLTNKQMEYLRILIPQPVYLGLVVFASTLPVFLVLMLLAWPAVRATKAIPVLGFLLIPVVGSLGTVVIFTLIRMLAWASGYRPFSFSTDDLDEQRSKEMASRLLSGALGEGFSLFWENPQTGFIAVKGIEMEKAGQRTLSGTRFPIRCVCLRGMNGMRLRLRLQVRSISAWHTGETRVLHELGSRLLQAAGLQEPGLS